MREPKYPKTFSNRYGNDYRSEEILKYKTQTYEVVSMLEEYAAKKAELVDKTPFDSSVLGKNTLDIFILKTQNRSHESRKNGTT